MAHTSPLLNLPAELRMSIYEFYLSSLTRLDSFELSRLQSYSGATTEDQGATQTYSFLFTLPLIHKEALTLVTGTHPILFKAAVDTLPIPPGRLRCQDRIGHVVLDFDACAIDVLRDAIRDLAQLPALHTIEVLLSHTPTSRTSILPQGCPCCMFTSLRLLVIVEKPPRERDLEVEAEQVERAEISRLRAIEDTGMPLSRDEQALMGRLCIQQLYRQTSSQTAADRHERTAARRRLRMLNTNLKEQISEMVRNRLAGKHTCR
ncbi:hypothetical protein LTR53_005985 [Teratosphaeriaceae sp. CCFEE 6253]|nr:hypothetical protein LTR53_005985 [Teratosphaeriaceae sp. CCFEE 6253]